MRARTLRLVVPGFCVAFLWLAAGPRVGADSQLSSAIYGPFPFQIAVGPSPQSARESSISEAERVSREIIRTNRLIGSVEPKVNRSQSDKAKDDLATAVARQVESRDALAQSQLARAMRLTLEARAFAKSAGIKVGPPADDPETVARALDQTDDALDRADDVLREGAGPSERRRFDTLWAQQKEAHGYHKDGEHRRAYAATRKVRDGVLELLRDCADLPVSEVTARKALDRAERAMEQAKDELKERPGAEARRHERAAEDQMQKARSAFTRRNYRDTLLHAKLVERNLELALDAQRISISQSG
jgi:hypothetical protein